MCNFREIVLFKISLSFQIVFSIYAFYLTPYANLDHWWKNIGKNVPRFHILFEFMYFLCLRTMGTIETFNLLMIVLNLINEWKRYWEKMYHAKFQLIWVTFLHFIEIYVFPLFENNGNNGGTIGTIDVLMVVLRLDHKWKWHCEKMHQSKFRVIWITFSHFISIYVFPLFENNGNKGGTIETLNV